jgi:hypothetical protein
MRILGISAFYHDSAACLVRDGEVIAAAQEPTGAMRCHLFHLGLLPRGFIRRFAVLPFLDRHS